MTPVSEDHVAMAKDLGLKEYHAKALANLIELGETKATELSSASGVPKARIYGVLDELADMGLIEKKPGRPTKYLPKSPEDIIKRTIENRRSEAEEEIERIEEMGEKFESEFEELYERARGNRGGRC